MRESKGNRDGRRCNSCRDGGGKVHGTAELVGMCGKERNFGERGREREIQKPLKKTQRGRRTLALIIYKKS